MLFSFEDKADIVVSAINRKRSKWRLQAISWMDFDDVKQILLIHINEKWHTWDQSRPLERWLNGVIKNQLINLTRNHYYSSARPCLKCSSNQGGNLCAIYREQCVDCPLYRKWASKKRISNNLKLPASFDDDKNINIQETMAGSQDSFVDYEVNSRWIHEEMQKRLKGEHYEIYRMIYIECMGEDEVAKIKGYKENPYNKKNKYKQLENYKKFFYSVAREVISDGKIL